MLSTRRRSVRTLCGTVALIAGLLTVRIAGLAWSITEWLIERDTGRVSGDNQVAPDFVDAILFPKWTPREAFGSSRPLDAKLFRRGLGIYLRSNPRFGDGDPVFAVCWAESDYWAQRSWSWPRFEGDDSPTAAESPAEPDLTGLGKPTDLSYGSIHEFEAAQSLARSATLVTAKYRMTDGMFLCCEIKGTHGVSYVYGSIDPQADDKPVAVEVRLRDV